MRTYGLIILATMLFACGESSNNAAEQRAQKEQAQKEQADQDKARIEEVKEFCSLGLILDSQLTGWKELQKEKELQGTTRATVQMLEDATRMRSLLPKGFDVIGPGIGQLSIRTWKTDFEAKVVPVRNQQGKLVATPCKAERMFTSRASERVEYDGTIATLFGYLLDWATERGREGHGHRQVHETAFSAMLSHWKFVPGKTEWMRNVARVWVVKIVDGDEDTLKDHGELLMKGLNSSAVQDHPGYRHLQAFIVANTYPLWEATLLPFPELKAQKNLPERWELEGKMYRRWQNAGGGENAERRMKIFRYWLARLVHRVGGADGQDMLESVHLEMRAENRTGEWDWYLNRIREYVGKPRKARAAKEVCTKNRALEDYPDLTEALMSTMATAGLEPKLEVREYRGTCVPIVVPR